MFFSSNFVINIEFAKSANGGRKLPILGEAIKIAKIKQGEIIFLRSVMDKRF